MKVVVAVHYIKEKKTNNQIADSVAIYDINKDVLEVLTTRRAKEKFKAQMLRVANADFTFYVNEVNFTIGEQFQYPILFIKENPKTKKDEYEIQDAALIYDIKPNKDGAFNCLINRNTQFKATLLDENKLKEFKENGYKTNYDFDKNN